MAEDTEIYSGEKIRRLPTGARRWKNNINESYAKFYKAGSDSLLSLLHTSDVSAIASARTFTLEHKRRKRGGLYLALTIALTFCRFTLEDF